MTLRAWLRGVAAPLLASRLLWLVVAVAFVLLQEPGTPLLAGLHGTLLQWDAKSYIEIAQHGYPTHLDYHDAFLPGYPILVRAVSAVARDDVLAAWIVNVVAEAVALTYITRLVLHERDRAAATFAVWLVALAPTALFFVAPFTESAFIAASAGALYHARTGRTMPACVAAAVACVIRLTGLALIPALALEAVVLHRGRSARELLPILLIPVPLLAYCAYMQVHMGDALAILHAEQLPSFGQSPAAPWDGFTATWNALTTATDGETRSIFAREVAAGVLGLVACAFMWASARVPRSFALYCSVAWLLTASESFWRSEPRYLLALFPAVLLLGDMTARARAARPALVVGSAALMTAGTLIFAQGRWLG